MTDDDQPAVSSAVYFFIPLPEPLPVPDGLVVVSSRHPGVEDLERLGAAAFTNVSMKFHQVDLAPDPHDTLTAAVFSVASDVAGTTPSETPPGAYPTGTAALTVVEAAVPVPGSQPESDDEDDDWLTEEFDRAIEEVRHVQRAYAMLSQQPVRLVSQRTLPVALPTAMGRVPVAQPDDGPSGTPPAAGPTFDGLSVFLVNLSAMQATVPGPTVDVDDMGRAMEQMTNARSFAAFIDLRREAWAQFRLFATERRARSLTSPDPGVGDVGDHHPRIPVDPAA